MKIKNWLLLLLILVCAAVFVGYRQLDHIRTDTEAPEITVDAAQLQVSVQDPKSALLQGVTAVDKKDGSVTDSLVVESVRLASKDGTVEVVYAAFDSAGNVAKAERKVQYTDYVSPKFNLNRPLAYIQSVNFDILSAVEANDVFDGDIQHRVRATMLTESSIAALGTHYVQFQVTNSLGDTAELALPVEVYSSDLYNAGLTLTNYLVYLPMGSAFNPQKYLDTFTLLGEEISLENGLPADYELRTSGQVMTQMPGVYPVEFRLTYTDRHETNPDLDREYTGYSKLIVVVEG